MHTDTYSGFKAQIHKVFPVIIDTKHLCYTVQKVSTYCQVLLSTHSLLTRFRNCHRLSCWSSPV